MHHFIGAIVITFIGMLIALGIQWKTFTVGTKSVLIGAHCFFLHPFFVAWAWTRLYGFPFDPRLWVAFFVHDLGYIGKPNMDGVEGEAHPVLGARIMAFLFDWEIFRPDDELWIYLRKKDNTLYWFGNWGQFSLLHSRYFAKQVARSFSRLCVADKLAFALTPRWLYLPMVVATGEIHEYLHQAKTADNGSVFKQGDYSGRLYEWHAALSDYMQKWVAEHKDGKRDTWTSSNRQADKDGVTR